MDDAEPYDEDDYEPAEDDDERDECGDFIYINTLNVKDSNYIWIFITGTSVKSLALIDSGAQVSVMPKKTFDPSLRRTDLPYVQHLLELKLVTGRASRVMVSHPSHLIFKV